MRLLGFVGTAACVLALHTPAFGDLLTGNASRLLVADESYVRGLSEPTALAFTPDGRMVITERNGAVKVRTSSGVIVQAGSFQVNSIQGEQGLLNVLAHPEFASNKRLFFYYSAADGIGGTNKDRHRVVSVELADDNTLRMNTQRVLLRNLPGEGNHNGGALSILGDKLFVGVGDMGYNSGRKPAALWVSNWNATCLTNPLGKVLRINLDGTIPKDNPLVGRTVTACGSSSPLPPDGTSTAPRAEIWAWGFRNPWRIFADEKTGNVWVGDVGELTFEEISMIPKGGARHFGWPFREGSEGRGLDACAGTEPKTGNCVDPVYVCEHWDSQPNSPNVPHDDCASITGGVILDDCRWPEELEGSYVFGDNSTRYMWSFKLNAQRNGMKGARREFGKFDKTVPVHFVEHDGALYVVGFGGGIGHIVRIRPAIPDACSAGASVAPPKAPAAPPKAPATAPAKPAAKKASK